MTLITTKAQLVERLNTGRAALEKILAKTAPDDLLKPGVCGEWSGKDILAHLADWQRRHMDWLSASQRGESPAVPASGYSWKPADVDCLNLEIFETHRTASLEDVLAYFKGAHVDFMSQLEALPEEMLFKRGAVPFVGARGTLARWYREYANHDGWGRNKIYNALVRKPRRP